MGVAIVTDSTAYLTDEQLAGAAAPVTVVPLHVIVGGRESREGADLGVADLADALRRFVPVTTSRPSPQEFLEAYQQAARSGADAIVSVHISAGLSATVQGAELAARQSPVPVHVVDSGTLGAAMGYAVLSGAAAAAAGGGPDEVAAVVRSRAEAAYVVFYVHTLEHLRRGGRIGAAAAVLGSALAIKPILTVSDGRISALEKVRTSARALARMVELAGAVADEATAAGRAVDVAVQHLDLAERAEEVRSALAQRIPTSSEIRVGELGAVVGAHVGPGTLAICVAPRSDR